VDSIGVEGGGEFIEMTYEVCTYSVDTLAYSSGGVES